MLKRQQPPNKPFPKIDFTYFAQKFIYFYIFINIEVLGFNLQK